MKRTPGEYIKYLNKLPVLQGTHTHTHDHEDVGREPKQTRVEHANSTQEVPGIKPGTFCCEVTVITTNPLYHTGS